MSKEEKQILINQIKIMEALVTIFKQSNDYGIACRNLELSCDGTYQLLREDRLNGSNNEKSM